MTFPARCPGTCVECGTRFHVGDLIRHDEDHDDWVHASCSEPPHDNPEPCPTCWLTIYFCKDTTP